MKGNNNNNNNNAAISPLALIKFRGIFALFTFFPLIKNLPLTNTLKIEDVLQNPVELAGE